MKYVDTGATMSREWARTFRPCGYDAASASEVAVDSVGRRDRGRHPGPSEPHRQGSDIVVLKYSSAGELRLEGDLRRARAPRRLRQRPGARRRTATRSWSAPRPAEAPAATTSPSRCAPTAPAPGCGATPGPEAFDEARGVAVDPRRQRVRHRLVTDDKEPARGARTPSATAAGGAQALERPRRHAAELDRRRDDRHVLSGVRGAARRRRLRRTRGSGHAGYDEPLMFAKYSALDGRPGHLEAVPQLPATATQAT